MNGILDWFGGAGLKIAIILLVAFLIQKSMTVLIRKAVYRSIRMDKDTTERNVELRGKTISRVIISISTVALWVIVVIMALAAAGVNVAPIIAGASILGLAVSFGAQSLVKDVIAGLFIIIENQYRVGDAVKLNGIGGAVEEVNLRTTVVRDLSGNRHHIPNGSIEFATNKTMEFSKINMKVGVSYDSDIDEVEKVVNKVGHELAEDEIWHRDIQEAPHFVRVSSFDDSAVKVMIVGRTEPARQWAVAGEFRRRLKKAFDKSNIEIPYQQVVIHNKK